MGVWYEGSFFNIAVVYSACYDTVVLIFAGFYTTDLSSKGKSCTKSAF